VHVSKHYAHIPRESKKKEEKQLKLNCSSSCLFNLRDYPHNPGLSPSVSGLLSEQEDRIFPGFN